MGMLIALLLKSTISRNNPNKCPAQTNFSYSHDVNDVIHLNYDLFWYSNTSKGNHSIEISFD